MRTFAINLQLETMYFGSTNVWLHFGMIDNDGLGRCVDGCLETLGQFDITYKGQSIAKERREVVTESIATSVAQFLAASPNNRKVSGSNHGKNLFFSPLSVLQEKKFRENLCTEQLWSRQHYFLELRKLIFLIICNVSRINEQNVPRNY